MADPRDKYQERQAQAREKALSAAKEQARLRNRQTRELKQQRRASARRHKETLAKADMQELREAVPRSREMAVIRAMRKLPTSRKRLLIKFLKGMLK